jgi:hypothetical protein
MDTTETELTAKISELKTQLQDAMAYTSHLEFHVDASIYSLCRTIACYPKAYALCIAIKVVADSLSNVRGFPPEHVSGLIADASKLINGSGK